MCPKARWAEWETCEVWQQGSSRLARSSITSGCLVWKILKKWSISSFSMKMAVKKGRIFGYAPFPDKTKRWRWWLFVKFWHIDLRRLLLCMGYPPKIPKDIQKSYLIDIKWSCFVHLHSDCLIMPVSETPGSLYDRDNPKSRCLFLNPSRSYAFAHPSRDLPSNYWMHHLRTRNWHEVSQNLNRTG